MTANETTTSPRIGRREVLKGAAALAAATSLVQGWAPGARADTAAGPPEPVRLSWLEGKPDESLGCTVGVPWPKGSIGPGESFALSTADGVAVPVQSWPTAYWPDGTLKWTAHAVGPDADAAQFVLRPGDSADAGRAVIVEESARQVDVDTGVIQIRIPKQGSDLVSHVRRNGRLIASKGRLVNLLQTELPDPETAGGAERYLLVSDVRSVTVEQDGPVRAVIRIEGTHHGDVAGQEWSWLPFTVRLYLYAGAESIRMVHSFVFDSDGQQEFVAGLGVQFAVPMRDRPYDRHVRLVGNGPGMLTEALLPLTGLRQDPGAAARSAQVAGEPVPDSGSWDEQVDLKWIPTWSDYTLTQLTSEGFAIEKRTQPGCGWIPVDQGKRASGFGYLGGASGGGLAFGMRDFWQRHPTQLDIRNAMSDLAHVTVWMWSPRSTPMDTRFYHDGLGQDTYEKQLDALGVTYEDYEPGFGTPYGISRTTELVFWAVERTPSTDRLGRMADVVRTPPQLTARPEQFVAAGVFGGLFAPVDRSDPAKARIEDHLDFLFDHYAKQQEQRHWYGFWNYGDVMHSSDADRKVWRYDIGGYAWDNSELSPDLWLWFAYLRSGRADIYRFAEAMTRHTGEVDVYHLGDWKGLGTRHGVQHWGDSAKQVRISTAVYRRFFYLLTADERTGDLMRELVDAERTFLVLDPSRKIREDDYEPKPTALDIGLGTSWSGLAAGWLTEWERRGPNWREARSKLLGTMETIAAQPNGFFQDGPIRYNMRTHRFTIADQPSVRDWSHLAAMFGAVEVYAELIDLVDMPEFEAAWLQYCRLYQAPAAEQEAELGASGGSILNLGHTRLEAYAAVRLDEDKYAKRAWGTFLNPPNEWEYGPWIDWSAERVDSTLNPTDYAAWVNTNETAMYGLAAIQNLALIGDKLPR